VGFPAKYDARTMNPRLTIKRVGPLEVPVPSYQTAGAAGLDLCAALNAPVMLEPGQHRLFPTGICVEIPDGFEGQVRPRSGLALRHGITVLNSPGTIDADYRGELGIVLINHGPSPVEIKPLDRIAQLVIAAVVRVEIEVVTTLSETSRAASGYGSTGV
jgi:dUTP diphosphatase